MESETLWQHTHFLSPSHTLTLMKSHTHQTHTCTHKHNTYIRTLTHVHTHSHTQTLTHTHTHTQIHNLCLSILRHTWSSNFHPTHLSTELGQLKNKNVVQVSLAIRGGYVPEKFGSSNTKTASVGLNLCKFPWSLQFSPVF